jgi:hypothetical protein
LQLWLERAFDNQLAGWRNLRTRVSGLPESVPFSWYSTPLWRSSHTTQWETLQPNPSRDHLSALFRKLRFSAPQRLRDENTASRTIAPVARHNFCLLIGGAGFSLPIRT